LAIISRNRRGCRYPETDPQSRRGDKGSVGRTGAQAVSVDWEILSRTLRPENSPGFLLWQVANQWQRLRRAALETVGLTNVQFVLLAGLAWLERKEGVVSQSRLASFCRTDAMMTSQVIRALERDGYVTRRPHPTDRRARRIVLTEKGAELLNRAMPIVRETDTDYFGGGADSKPMVDLLRRLWRAPGRGEG
jgi:DNA-binding MarR family transcriptional regulator